MRVLAIPNHRYPPGGALALADVVLATLGELTASVIGPT
jgi:hypothetical protein